MRKYFLTLDDGVREAREELSNYRDYFWKYLIVSRKWNQEEYFKRQGKYSVRGGGKFFILCSIGHRVLSMS